MTLPAMEKPPAVVIIVRHGARLDAANKQWHLTSPTPYDPPLTYGGWTQSRALGARIASILHTREETHLEAVMRETGGLEENGDSAHRKHHHRRKKHKVIIHTSPFVRCVQTSIGIAAGLGQFHQPTHHIPHPVPNHHIHARSPYIHAHDKSNSPRLAAILEPEEEHVRSTSRKTSPHRHPFEKACLRIDAFLGEWLSPDYFDHITPPPGSVMMIASAKADLLRRGEEIKSGTENTGSGHFPGGWGSATSTPISEDVGTLDNMSAMGKALTQRGHHGSDAGIHQQNRVQGSGLTRLSTNIDPVKPSYTPPTPTYAISSSDPIPAGYVTHARDACVDVDYQWDSMREPQNWGTGGEYGEEWSAMHKRFRNGVFRMIDWYKTHDTPCTNHHHHRKENNSEEEEESDHTDTVLILVTHGAGCNALIGAITNQPVLMDVGMASLTMAVRKDILHGPEKLNDLETVTPVTPAPMHMRRTSNGVGLSDDYEIKLLASTDHLKSNTPLMGPKSQQSPIMTGSPINAYRNRLGSATTSQIEAFSIGDPVRSYGLNRSSSLASHEPRARSGSGLWGNTQGSVISGIDTSTEKVRADANTTAATSTAGSAVNDEKETDEVSPLAPSPASRGLWGGGPPATDTTPKRRWTVTES